MFFKLQSGDTRKSSLLNQKVLFTPSTRYRGPFKQHINKVCTVVRRDYFFGAWEVALDSDPKVQFLATTDQLCRYSDKKLGDYL